jgi:NADH-quinone oxidoreductase subunit G
MDVKALGVGARGVQSVILPNESGALACEECGMCIDICPVGALTSGTYRYQTRPWEMTYSPVPCTHCSNGCKTTLSVRNNEIMRANNRDHSGINGEFLCTKGRFAYDFTAHPDRIRQPLVRRNGGLQPATWEDALEEVARRLKQVHDQHGASAIGVIGSNHTTNEENYVLGRFARATLGTNNIDHHRTADYAGLALALGNRAHGRLATMEQIATAPAILLIGNDATQQNPLVAWQIRNAVRQNNANLYIVHAGPLKLERQAAQFVKIPAGMESSDVEWLASGAAEMPGALADAQLSDSLKKLRTALQKENDVVILFGAAIAGKALRQLAAFGNGLPGQTRYMALGDYANSRGAADMGLLPDFLPGYARVTDPAARAAFGKLWGAELPTAPGMDARAIMNAAAAGQLRALYVVGANPVKTFSVPTPDRLAGLDLLVVQDVFLTETAQRADIVLPAASSYEKDGTLTNTAGEIQMTRRAVDSQGPRTDFDLLRILIHQLSALGLGTAMRARTPEGVFEEIQRHVSGYSVSMANLLMGHAEQAISATSAENTSYDAGAGAVFSSNDTLFTSGTLGRYCSKLTSCNEAKDIPWSSSPTTQSWWYR